MRKKIKQSKELNTGKASLRWHLSRNLNKAYYVIILGKSFPGRGSCQPKSLRKVILQTVITSKVGQFPQNLFHLRLSCFSSLPDDSLLLEQVLKSSAWRFITYRGFSIHAVFKTSWYNHHFANENFVSKKLNDLSKVITFGIWIHWFTSKPGPISQMKSQMKS